MNAGIMIAIAALGLLLMRFRKRLAKINIAATKQIRLALRQKAELQAKGWLICE